MSKLSPGQKPSPAPSSAAEASPNVAKPTPVRVFIHHDARSEREAAMARVVAARLRETEFEVVAVRAVPFIVRTDNARYFFNQDREGARKLAAALGAVAGSGGPRSPQNFSYYEPKPSRGTVEI
jgi:hypothetical protein